MFLPVATAFHSLVPNHCFVQFASLNIVVEVYLTARCLWYEFHIISNVLLVRAARGGICSQTVCCSSKLFQDVFASKDNSLSITD